MTRIHLAFGFLAALIALIACSPLLILIALIVMFDSPGGPFYFARRIGKGGTPFRMWKFRTMIVGASLLGPPITGRNDPRITRVGRFLRNTKLDELPQFVNVLLGDMALVGPRPESPEIVALYTPSQRRVLAVKPGITGRVQLDSGEESDAIPEQARADDYYVRHLMERKLLADLDYLDTRTPFSDLHILLATATLVLRSLVRR